MKRLKIVATLAACVMSLGLVAGCSQSTSSDTASETGASESSVEQTEAAYPVTIENNGVEWTYESAPEKVIAADYVAAQLMCALGLEDHVMMIAPGDYDLADVSAEYQDTIEAMTMFDESQLNLGVVPTFEAVLATDPDMVIGNFYTFMDSNAGSIEKYVESGVNAYASEGTYVEQPTLEHVYNDIANLGLIFDVEERADELIAELKAREEAVVEALADVDEATPVFVYDFDTEGSINTTGGTTLEDYLISLAGGKNVFDSLDTQYATISTEEIASMDAEWVIVNAYTSILGDDSESKIETLKSDALYAEVPAVVNDNFKVVRVINVQPGLQALDALEDLAQTLHPEAFE